jgi:hypothetical protein
VGFQHGQGLSEETQGLLRAHQRNSIVVAAGAGDVLQVRPAILQSGHHVAHSWITYLESQLRLAYMRKQVVLALR